MSFLRYIRQHPFSVMALCNIVGDLCWLGFAFAAQGLVSPTKLAGALFTMAAHMVLLAYGDDQAKHVATEAGALPRLVLSLRAAAQSALHALPKKIQDATRAKPIGIPFAMLSLNGIALLTDALLAPPSFAGVSQALVGACVFSGCAIFALADFIGGQKTANLLLKIGPTLLLGASISNVGLALATHNGFVMLSLFVFLLSNFAAFYTKIDKKEPISAGF